MLGHAIYISKGEFVNDRKVGKTVASPSVEA